VPTAGGTPRPTAALVCPAGPLTVAQFLAADPSCYLDVEVAVVGWWDWSHDDDPGGRLDHLLRGSMPFGARGSSEDIVFVDESDAVPRGGWPDGAHWATVTGRRSPTNDRACHRDRDADLTAAPHCPSYLVATSVVESEAPSEQLAACEPAWGEDDEGAIDAGWFTGYPPACFGSRDVSVRGWFDIRYLITGWEEPWGIAPGWLWLPIGPWTVVAPGSNAEATDALLVYIDPARGLDVSRTNRWVVLTGHYADAKAGTCQVEYSGGYDPARDGERIPDSYAQRVCEAHFVVTSIRDTTP
jgi:hypothetical protein